MEAMGADVSQKIRSAIKAKLIELGVYIDDELPDYIMVMVANKKTKAQMDDDLHLFLAANTSKFTTWLHEVLERLQSVTSDSVNKKSGLLEPKSAKATVIQQESDVYDVQDEILAIKAEQEEDDLLAEELALNKPNDSTERRKQIVVSPVQRNRVEREIPIIDLGNVRGSKRPVPITMERIPPKRRAPSSQVGAVLSRPVESDDDDDDENFHSTGIASVVKISERRSSVPPSMQANKTLLMRAVAEAKKSVLESTKKNIFDTELSTQPQLFTRKHRAAAAVVLPTKSSLDVRKLDETIADLYPKAVEIEEYMQVDEETNGKRCIIASENDKNVGASPTFIVTLDGVDPSSFSSKQQPELFSESDSIDLENEEEYRMLIDADDIDDLEKESDAKSSERCKYWPTCKNGSECSYQHPTKQCKTFPNCRFGDKCHYIHPNCKYDATCTRQSCPYTHASRRILNQMPPAIVLAPKFRRNAAPKEKQCKFYPKCSNLNCSFYHPKPCRYGLSCTQSGCNFFHPPLPTRDKLRWTSTSSTQTTA